MRNQEDRVEFPKEINDENENLYEIGSCSLKISSYMNEYHKHNVK
jgi:hypothetical protein